MSAWDAILQAGKAALPYLPGIIQGVTQGRPGVMPGGAPLQGFGGGTFGGFGLPVTMGAGPGIGRGMGRMRSVNRSASTYCRRHPAWCTQVGGLGAVANMVAGGQLPLTRSSRGRGISSRELRAFRKVHRVLRKVKLKTR